MFYTWKGQYGNGRNAGAIDELRFGPLGSWYHILFRLRVRCLDDGFDRHDNDRTHKQTCPIGSMYGIFTYNYHEISQMWVNIYHTWIRWVWLGGVFKCFLFSPRNLGKIFYILTSIFFRWVVETTNRTGRMKYDCFLFAVDMIVSSIKTVRCNIWQHSIRADKPPK